MWTAKPRIVHVLRNPKDVAVSFYHFYQNTAPMGKWDRGWGEFLDMFLAGNTIYGDWFTYHKEWYAHRHDPNVFYITYEAMKADHKGAVCKVAKFLGKDLKDEVVDSIVKSTSFKAMQANPKTNYSTFELIDTSRTPFIRKGEVGDWKNYFTIAQNESFDQYFEEQMKEYEELKTLCACQL